MKRFGICLFLFALTIVISACGKTEFSSSEGSSFKAGEASSGGGALEELANNPALAKNHTCDNGAGKKVLVCHVPPGNADAAHTICISVNALKAHIDKHTATNGDTDTLGDCADRVPVPEEPPSAPPPTEEVPE